MSDHCRYCGGGAVDLAAHEANCVMRDPPRTECIGCGRVMSLREREQGVCEDCKSGAMERWERYCAKLKREADRR